MELDVWQLQKIIKAAAKEAVSEYAISMIRSLMRLRKRKLYDLDLAEGGWLISALREH